ncbi:sec-independent protein translocase protein TatC [Micrococcus cohnii]|uniref:Sec-independent protein translocase protein TatC n=2 Tax=Micrococcus cohnii TaxID=993416 RepID=A0A7W7GN88_9MICC|nr:twin-arginine translocase subunit TatC [Micrococcus cohnii]MBB4735261.1 sec-independent protein translocase protein TatC [Micrococcus cohnii]
MTSQSTPHEAPVAQGGISAEAEPDRAEQVRADAPGRTRGRRRKPKKPKNPNGEMPLKEHLKELRDRLIKAAIAVVLGAVVGFIVYKPVFETVTKPIAEASGEGQLSAVTFDTVGAPFDVMLQVAFFIGVVVSSPVWLYQIWAFIVPGLKRNEKKYAIGFLSAAIPLFLLGIFLGWLVLPQAVIFFFGFTPEAGANMIPAQTYIPFVLRLLLAFGAALVLPVLLVGLNMLGMLPGRTIVKHWRITVFGIAVIAALAAPGGDAISMFYLAAPLVVLFGVAIALCLVNDKRRSRRRKVDEARLEQEIASGPKPLHEL